MLFLGTELDAQTAHQWGLIHSIADEALGEATSIADMLLTRGPLALEMAKEAIHRGSELPLRDGLRLEGDLNHQLAATEDRAEGLAACKTTPRFFRTMNGYWLPENLNDRGSELAAIITKRMNNDVLDGVEKWVEMPERLIDNPTRPDPATSWGDGFLCLDLGPDDGATWGRFKDVVEGDEDPESIARRAQVWRLPVTPYRKHPVLLAPNEVLAIPQILLNREL